MQSVSPWKRIGYTLIDITIYSTLTFSLASLFGWSPVFDFMGAYTPEQQEQYWGMFWLAVALVSVGSLTSHATWGKSIGKWLCRARTVKSDGTPLGLMGAFQRILYIWATIVLVFVPGPFLGFLFGNAANTASVVLLWVALIAIAAFAVWPWHPDRSPWLQPYFGIKTIDDPQ